MQGDSSAQRAEGPGQPYPAIAPRQRRGPVRYSYMGVLAMQG